MPESIDILNEEDSSLVEVRNASAGGALIARGATLLQPCANQIHVAMSDTAWSKTKKYSGTAYSKALKPGFNKAWAAFDKLGAPVNRLSNKLGSEAFWPTTLDKESDKAARILRSFCKDGFYEKVDEAQAQKAAETGEKVEGPQGKQRVLKKIPEKVIRQAKGLAIFTTMRTGLWVSGAGGSGILVARDEETGEWSPPSGILLHTAGLGFLVGVDIYDCVVVINTYKALEAFTKIRCTLGGEVSAVAGPVGIGGLLETEVHKRQAPVWTYLKSRGFYAGVQVDGTIVIERSDENERFYGERISVADILARNARYPPKEKYKVLMDTIRAAQGEEIDESLLPTPGEPTPGDQSVELSGDAEANTFGIPDSEDPDPFGVKALANEGIEILEKTTEHVIESGDEIDGHDTDSHDRSGASTPNEHLNGDHEEDEQEDEQEEDEDVEVHEAQPVIVQAKMVTIPKRLPPSLPPRNPGRLSTPVKELEETTLDEKFDNVSLNADHDVNGTAQEEQFHSVPPSPTKEVNNKLE
ncbi:hypothetical protein UCRPC4_g02616 [Phaeomoniella chlamydospora]|uniref:Ysc84 actin-binding domain-containing protein n=1 Tax=Phaeomoniella chlamydospora TaxID=158046 RepID=A0A0G2H616_PHACM|nr:hypothetical protein UCRPC4_g02616 [Phaeomoniella chlamydospora]